MKNHIGKRFFIVYNYDGSVKYFALRLTVSGLLPPKNMCRIITPPYTGKSLHSMWDAKMTFISPLLVDCIAIICSSLSIMTEND